MHRAGNLWWGLVLIALGVLFLLDNMNVIEFGEAIRTYWPALLILWGVSVLLRRSSRSAASAGGSEEAAAPAAEAHEVFSDRDERPDTEHINYSSVFGDVSLHLVSTHFQGGTVSTVFGDTTIDLSAVTLADGESTLKVSGVFGNMRVTLASTTAYALSANSLFGSVEAGGQKRDGFSSVLSFQSPDYASAPKKIRLDMSQVFGNVMLIR
jgi:predicted membrane protein